MTIRVNKQVWLSMSVWVIVIFFMLSFSLIFIYVFVRVCLLLVLMSSMGLSNGHSPVLNIWPSRPPLEGVHSPLSSPWKIINSHWKAVTCLNGVPSSTSTGSIHTFPPCLYVGSQCCLGEQVQGYKWLQWGRVDTIPEIIPHHDTLWSSSKATGGDSFY